MRAVSYTRFGAPGDVLELSDVDTPAPSAGEVLVRLHVSGVNPSDAKARAGNRPGVTKPAYPRIIPHSDGAGVIAAVGAGVNPGRIGQRVWVWNGQWQRSHGTAAEFIALPAEQAVPLPEGVSFDVGATLGIPGLTAAQTVFGAAGAEVIATCSAPAMERVRAAGARHVFDYADPDLAAQIMAATAGRGVARAIEVEFGQNAALLAEVMAPNGTIAAYGSGKDMAPTLPFGPYLFKALKIDITLIYILPWPAREAAIARLHAALEAGTLRPEIAMRLPLADCASAHEAVMTPGRAGAVLLEIG